MMKIVFLFILIFTAHCWASTLPASLKCVDKFCNDNISTARALQLITSISGELKELKKSTKVNIKGKNVDSNDVLWLVELNGSKGFFNSSQLKENIHNAKHDLQVVDNPFYIQLNATVDETEDSEDDKSSKLFSKQVPSKTNLISNYDETEDNESIPDKGNSGSDKNLLKDDKVVLDNKESAGDLIKADNVSTTAENNKNPEVATPSTPISNDSIKDNKDVQLTESNITVTETSVLENKSSAEPSLNDSTVVNSKSITNVNEEFMTKELNELKNDSRSAASRNFSDVVNNEPNSTLNQETLLENFNLSDNKSALTGLNNESIADDKEGDSTNNQGTVISGHSDSSNESNENTQESIEDFRSPLLILMLKMEKSLYPLIQSIIKKTGLDSWIYLTKFVNNWLCMSLANFVFLLFLFLSLVIIGYTPKMLRIHRDWKYEFEKQSQIVLELELKVKVIEEVRQKLTIQNRNFEKVIDEYKDQVRHIQEEATQNRRMIMSDVEKMKKINEKKIQKLTRDLEVTVQQCEVLERYTVERDTMIDDLNDARQKIECGFTKERIEMKESEKVLQERLLEVDDLKEELRKMSIEKSDLNDQMENASEMLNEANRKLDKLQNGFEHFRMFDELEEEERREKVSECLESLEVRQRLEELEVETDKMRKQLHLANEQRNEFEDKCRLSERLAIEYEEQRTKAVKNQETAEATLKVMTEYFQKKEIEMQKSLGHESSEKSLSIDKSDGQRHRIDNLQTENDSLSKTILSLKTEVKEMRSLASKCKTDANSQIATAFMTISNLERDLMREKEEGKKLRCKLSNYIGPITSRSAVTNHQRPPSQHSGASDTANCVPPPPLFNLSMLAQSTVHKVPFSGRSSANSMSKKSNNS